jgi:hypothetical protein
VTRDQASHQGQRKIGTSGFSLFLGGKFLLLAPIYILPVLISPAQGGRGDLSPDTTLNNLLLTKAQEWPNRGINRVRLTEGRQCPVAETETTKVSAGETL